MRVKILSSTSSFNGVTYNTNKTQNEKGELTRLRNFGYLQDTKDVGPIEVKNYLMAHSNRNTLVKDKQFHALISCKGRAYSKEELTDIAHEWIDKMGYGDNPFLIVFHGGVFLMALTWLYIRHNNLSWRQLLSKTNKKEHSA